MDTIVRSRHEEDQSNLVPPMLSTRAHGEGAEIRERRSALLGEEELNEAGTRRHGNQGHEAED